MNTRYPKKYLYYILATLMALWLYIWLQLPVVKDVEVSNDRTTVAGVMFDVNFTKVKTCEFQRVVWYSASHESFPVVYGVSAEYLPKSRKKGKHLSKDWLIAQLFSLKGSYAFAEHICLGVFTKYTLIYRHEDAPKSLAQLYHIHNTVTAELYQQPFIVKN